MYVKDMPSVALGCMDKPANRVKLDFALDSTVVDDRIQAAYAIVELGERDSLKGVEFPSTEEEDLDVDEEVEQYQQVPRSPECRRKDRRGHFNRSAEASPVRETSKSSEYNLPRVAHVKGAVMPTRTTGTAAPKVSLKRRLEDDASGVGIKAKLARMLIERKSSQEEAKRSTGDGDEDEEVKTGSGRGRFVRTSMPVLEPIYTVSSIHSSNFEKKHVLQSLEEKLEQSYSTEEINKLRDSFQNRGVNEEVCDPESKFNHFEVSVENNNGKNCSFEVPLYTTKSDSCHSKIPSFHENRNDMMLTKHSDTSEKLSAVKHEVDVSCASSWPILVSPVSQLGCDLGMGFMQYYMLSSILNSLPASSKSGSQPIMSREVNALKRLEQFSHGANSCNDLASNNETLLPDPPLRHSWNNLPLANSFYPRFGSLTSISSYYSHSNSPASETGYPSSSETGYPSSSLPESLSLQDLTAIPGDSPKLTNASFKKQPLRQQKHSIAVNQEIQREQNMKRKPRQRVLAVLEALEMIKKGSFGSLKTIRRLYETEGPGNPVNSSSHLLQNTQSSELLMKTECQPLQFEGQAQELPLDLSKYRRRISYEFSEPNIGSNYRPTASNSFESVASVDSFSGAKNGEGKAYSAEMLVKLHVCNDVNNAPAMEKAEMKVIQNYENDLASLSIHSVPNSKLPPKKRKIHQPSQSFDFSESNTLPSAVSTFTPQRPQDRLEPYTLHSKASEPVSEAKLLPVVAAEENALLSAVAVRDEDGDLPLHIAVAQGSVDVVRKLLPVMLKAGVSVDSCNNNRQTALHLAVISNQSQLVETLLNMSASPGVCDRKGNTAIHLAVKYKTLGCLTKILTGSRIPVALDARNYEGLTALHISVQTFQTEAVKVLLTSGADPNVADGTNGRTPLFYAVESNDYNMASTLLRHGSDPYIASYSGCTPLQIASAKSFRDMTGILEKSGKEWAERT